MASIGKYRILGKIGQGGSSSVYLVSDDRIDKKWAVKAIPKKHAQKDGILLLRSLDHPSLPRIVEELESGSSFFEVMDYYEGESLDTWASKGISVTEALRISEQILETAAYLHGQDPPVIHRDIKPGNFIITAERKTKLVDFDLAVSGEQAGLLPMGTKGYAPPEQYRGICTMRGDVYALGKTIRCILSQIQPKSIRLLDRPILKRISAVCDKAVMADPYRRYANALEMQAHFCKCTRLRKFIRPILAGSVAALLAMLLLLSGRNVLHDAFMQNSTRNIEKTYAKASCLLSEAIRTDAEKDKAINQAKKANELIQGSKQLLDVLPKEDREAMTDTYYSLHHAALVITGSAANTESGRADAFRTCLSDDLEYEEYLKRNRRIARLFRLYADDAAISRILGDSGSSQRYYEKALSLPGISKEERSSLIRSILLSSRAPSMSS